MRAFRKLGLILVLGGAAVPALAQPSAWDGTWAGTTEDGASVGIVIADARAAQYSYRGEDVVINGSGARGKSLQMDIGSGHSAIRLTKVGKNEIAYDYRGSDGSSARATLMRQ